MIKNLFFVCVLSLFGTALCAQESVAIDQVEQKVEATVQNTEEQNNQCINGVCNLDAEDFEDQDDQDIDMVVSMIEITTEPEAAVEKIQDKAAGLKFLEITHKNLELFVTTAQNAAASIAPDVDFATAVKQIDHALIDVQHKFIDSEKVELPEQVQRYAAQAILKAQEIAMQELLKNQPKTVEEYINALKFSCQLTFAAVINVVSYFYEVADEDLMPFVQNQLGEQILLADTTPVAVQ